MPPRFRTPQQGDDIFNESAPRGRGGYQRQRIDQGAADLRTNMDQMDFLGEMEAATPDYPIGPIQPNITEMGPAGGAIYPGPEPGPPTASFGSGQLDQLARLKAELDLAQGTMSLDQFRADQPGVAESMGADAATAGQVAMPVLADQMGMPVSGMGSDLTLEGPGGDPLFTYDLSDPAQLSDARNFANMPPQLDPSEMRDRAMGGITEMQLSGAEALMPQDPTRINAGSEPTRGQRRGRRAANRTLQGLDKLDL